jgi:hypothetical protein
MPGKSRRRKGKHLPQSKKRKSGRRFLATVVQQPEVAQTREPVSRPEVSAPSVSVPTPIAELAAVRYPHVVTELRMIGILAGIMLVILIVLALVLS